MSSIKSEPKQSILSRGKLGFFDSWVGGLSVMAEFRALYPELDMVYFGDRVNCPYGDRTPEEILALTLVGVARLVEIGCVIVIIACNTAAAHTIVYLQNEVYPPGSGIKILGVTVPGVEAALRILTVFSSEYSRSNSLYPMPEASGSQVLLPLVSCTIGVLATQVTVDAEVYTRKIQDMVADAQVIEIAVPWLVNLIESGATIWAAGQITFILDHQSENSVNTLLQQRLSLFNPEITKCTLPSILILGCTHYPLVQAYIEQAWKQLYKTSIIIINPGQIAAMEFQEYLVRHGEFALTKNTTIEVILNSPLQSVHH